MLGAQGTGLDDVHLSPLATLAELTYALPVPQNSFHRHIDPPDFPHLCRELAAALAALKQAEDVRVLAMGYDNPKMPEFVAVLDHEPSSAAIAAARAACSRYPHVNFVACGIGCPEHWSEISWDDHLSGQARPSRVMLPEWIKRAFRRS